MRYPHELHKNNTKVEYVKNFSSKKNNSIEF